MTILPPITDGLTALGHAIATAEGYGVEGAIPTRANNPGDLVEPWRHLDALGPERVTVFPTLDAGWAALTSQLALIRDDRSHVYLRSMTLLQMARLWTRTDVQDWAANVARALDQSGYPRGATTDTTLSAVFAASGD